MIGGTGIFVSYQRKEGRMMRIGIKYIVDVMLYSLDNLLVSPKLIKTTQIFLSERKPFLKQNNINNNNIFVFCFNQTSVGGGERQFSSVETGRSSGSIRCWRANKKAQFISINFYFRNSR